MASTCLIRYAQTAHTAHTTSPTPPPPPRDAIKNLTHRFLSMAMEELKREDTQERVREQLVTPLVKIMSTQMMPYVMALFALVVVILITCIMTFTLFAMSYFGRQLK